MLALSESSEQIHVQLAAKLIEQGNVVYYCGWTQVFKMISVKFLIVY